MINSLLFEFIMCAMLSLSPELPVGQFEIAEYGGNVQIVEFRLSGNSFEGMPEYILTISQGDDSEEILFRMVDNALCVFILDGQDAIQVDGFEYLQKISKFKSWKKFSIKSSDKSDTITVNPGKNELTLSLKKAKTKIMIKNGLLKNLGG